MMLKGKAHGGPRDGIMLEASKNWDGCLEQARAQRNQHNRKARDGWNGRYVWQDGCWQWEEGRLVYNKIEGQPNPWHWVSAA